MFFYIETEASATTIRLQPKRVVQFPAQQHTRLCDASDAAPEASFSLLGSFSALVQSSLAQLQLPMVISTCLLVFGILIMLPPLWFDQGGSDNLDLDHFAQMQIELEQCHVTWGLPRAFRSNICISLSHIYRSRCSLAVPSSSFFSLVFSFF